MPAAIRCHLESAEQAGNAALCLDAQDSTVRFQCVTLYAERHQDPEACELIEGADAEAGILRNGCVGGVAIAAIRPELCRQVEPQSLADSCLTQIVLERGGDSSLCEQVENPLLKQACAEAPPQ